MNIYNSRVKAQPEPTYSQVVRSTSSSSSQAPSTPTPQPSPPPTNYTPTGYEYDYVNFGLPHYDANYQYYNLIKPIDWLPKTPTTLILAMNNFHVLKVGLQLDEVNHLNSIIYEMHRAMSKHHYENIDVEYLTHNSLMYMKINDRTSIRLINNEYMYMAPTSVLTRWPTGSLNVVALCVTICGFRRCCGRMELTFHVKSMLIEDRDSYDEGYSEII